MSHQQPSLKLMLTGSHNFLTFQSIRQICQTALRMNECMNDDEMNAT